ncbi:MAG: hypothetical protein ACYS6W_15920 [Planctomycetota bacterium]|jgi:hypothetical protein
MKNVKMTVLVMALNVYLCVLPAEGWINFNDGGTHYINSEIKDAVRVDWEADEMETTLNIIDGAFLSNCLYAYGNSKVNLLGGAITDELYTADYSQVHMSGGSIGEHLCATENSQVHICGGTIAWDLEAVDNSRVVFSGGTIGTDLRVGHSSVLTIEGLDFAVDGEQFGYGELTSLIGGSYSDEPFRQLTGTLASGEPLDYYFRIGNDASIVLTPEPNMLLVLDPNGGESLVSGQTYTISWSNAGSVNDVLIEYSTNNGQHWSDVNAVPNTGSYEWSPVPIADSDQCLVRISDSSNSCNLDTSDGVFTISRCQTQFVGDLDGDCYVDFRDFAIFALDWLKCSNLFDPNCVQ